MTRPGRGDFPLLAGRLLLGAALLIPGLQKVGHPVEFARILANYRMLPAFLEASVSILVPRVEVGVGLCLVLGLLVRPAAAVAALLTAGFAVFVSSALVRGLNVECGCFSGASRVSGAHLGLDLILLLLALALLFRGVDRWAVEKRPAVSDRPFALGLIGVLVMAAPCFIPVPSRPDRNGPPSLVFDPPSVQLGNVKLGSTVRRTVRYTNTGQETLDIVWVQASCRCTVPQPDKRKLAPGESGELRIEYHASEDNPEIVQRVKVFEQGRSSPATVEVRGRVAPQAD